MELRVSQNKYFEVSFGNFHFRKRNDIVDDVHISRKSRHCNNFGYGYTR